MESFKDKLEGTLYQFYTCAIHGRYPELDAPVACWTEVMMLEAITCFFSFKECSELLKGRLQNMSWAMS